MENELYPLKFAPIIKDKIWGGHKLQTQLNKTIDPLPNAGESWEISGVDGNISVAANGFLEGNDLQELIETYMGDLVGDKVFEQFGVEFPLLIKFIDAADVLSVQVHPGDALSKERHNAYGKTEMWYVMQADANAQLVVGFKEEVTPEAYAAHLANNTIMDVLNTEAVGAGDVFFIPAGRVHAIGKGVLLAEIQQTSDITYRIYDFDRRDAQGNTRELHTDLALDAIDFKVHDNYRSSYEKELNKTANMVSCPYFKTNVLTFDAPIAKDYNLIDSFVIYMCVDGSFDVVANNRRTNVQKGETVLLPASLKNISLQPKGSAELLEVYID